MLDPLMLRRFVAIVDEVGFGTAASRLHHTQSRISAHLRRLETQLGKPLLARTTRSLELPPAGERVITDARASLALGRDALGELPRTHLPGRARMGLTADVAAVARLGVLHRHGAGHETAVIEIQVGIPGALLPMI